MFISSLAEGNRLGDKGSQIRGTEKKGSSRSAPPTVFRPILTTSHTRSSCLDPNVLMNIFCCLSVGRDSDSLTLLVT